MNTKRFNRGKRILAAIDEYGGQPQGWNSWRALLADAISAAFEDDEEPQVTPPSPAVETGTDAVVETVTVYVSIGNSDDKLTQAQWSNFWWAVDGDLRMYARSVHGAWTSESRSPWQNACWCAVVPAKDLNQLRLRLRSLAFRFRQDAITLAVVPEVEFIKWQGDEGGSDV